LPETLGGKRPIRLEILTPLASPDEIFFANRSAACPWARRAQNVSVMKLMSALAKSRHMRRKTAWPLYPSNNGESDIP
jgi:hypothetical protein